MRDLAEVLTHARSDADVLRRAGHETEAVLLERIAADVEQAAEEYLEFLSETDAMLYTGKKMPWLRSQFASLAERGHAKRHGRVRFYRMCVLPPRVDTARAFAKGTEAARKLA